MNILLQTRDFEKDELYRLTLSATRTAVSDLKDNEEVVCSDAVIYQERDRTYLAFGDLSNDKIYVTNSAAFIDRFQTLNNIYHEGLKSVIIHVKTTSKGKYRIPDIRF